MVRTEKRVVKVRTLFYIYMVSLTFFSCGTQEKSLGMYNVEDKEIYYSTIENLYQQQKLTEDTKNLILISDPEAAYTVHLLNKAVETEYPGWSGDFRFMQNECIEILILATIALEKGKSLFSYKDMSIQNNGNIPIDEGFIKQIISVYGLLFIQNPPDSAMINPSLIKFLHLLNLRAMAFYLLSVPQLLKAEITLSQEYQALLQLLLGLELPLKFPEPYLRLLYIQHRVSIVNNLLQEGLNYFFSLSVVLLF